MAPKRRWQLTLTLMPGSEPWVRVTGPYGAFKLHAEAPILDIIRGLSEHWSSWADTPRVQTFVSVRWEVLEELRAESDAYKAMGRPEL